MKFLAVFRTAVREQLRSPWDLALTLILMPAFIWMYWSFMGGSSTYYDLLVINQDSGASAAQVIERLGKLSYEGGEALLKVQVIQQRTRAEELLRSRKADALIIFSPGFSASIQNGSPASGGQVTFVGDLSNPYYSTTAIFANAVLESYLHEVSGQPDLIALVEEPLGSSGSRSEFEIYVPGLIIAAVTMMLFSVAIALTRQIESGVVRRLQLTRMRAFDLLGGIGLLYVLISLICVLLAFATARWLGFRSQGPLWVSVLVCTLTGVSVVGVGLITASFSGTVGRAAIIVNFPLILLLFFSGAIFPLGNPHLFSLFGRDFGLFDLLPQTHATVALNKVLTLGSGFGDVLYEVVMLAVLSGLYFALGVWLFRRMHLRAG